jgi:hypothetical protein
MADQIKCRKVAWESSRGTVVGTHAGGRDGWKYHGNGIAIEVNNDSSSDDCRVLR